MNCPREILIRPVLNGFLCQVGCQTLAFETREKMLVELEAYLRNPADTEKRFITNAVNQMMEYPVAPATPPPADCYRMASEAQATFSANVSACEVPRNR
jgi:hypothetical protein